jgi:hypothetical protein
MTPREFRRWAALHERRARPWWASAWWLAGIAGIALAAMVAWRGGRAGAAQASHAWLAVAIVAHGLAYVRVPFHLYWRNDAALLAQLPVAGRALFGAALVRCVRAAAATGLACALGAVPLATLSARTVAEATRQISSVPIAGNVAALTPLGFALRHLAYAATLAMTAGLLVPAVVVWAASLLVHRGDTQATATRARAAASAGTVLGAIPGAAGVIVLSTLIENASWLTGDANGGPTGLAVLVGASGLALALAVRASDGVMGAILRDVSALDRQRLASLEIKPPTALERVVARGLGGDAGLVYRKDARLMRRRYPMAYALGGLVFGVLVIVALARPGDPAPWLGATLSGGGIYALVLAGRVRRPPIELPRLVATLPVHRAALGRAKLAWPAAWLVVFVIAPLAFALARL